MLLTIYLRFIGIFLCLAFVAVLLPTSWMAAIHEALGLGTFPESQLVEYLTRSASMLYGGWGIVYLYVSFKVERYFEFLKFLCWLVGTFALALLILDLTLAMPLWWTLSEGPFILLHVVLLRLLMSRHVRLTKNVYAPRGVAQ